VSGVRVSPPVQIRIAWYEKFILSEVEGSLSTRAKYRKMNLINYIRDSFEELRNKVSWISWEEAQKSTVVVAVFTILFALAVFGVDKVFQTALTEYFKLF
jgi:preprotein translocase subunit SecE